MTLIFFLPPVFSYKVHQLLLRVRFAWDGHGLLHEGLIEVYLI